MTVERTVRKLLGDPRICCEFCDSPVWDIIQVREVMRLRCPTCLVERSFDYAGHFFRNSSNRPNNLIEVREWP